ncbi:ribonuclease P protein subunit RPR2 [Methanococcus voltae]|uniref:Ribonuclease P protein component 4 n=2 Tax=Methanococcus voltae TaxID=2188 RepID=A0A8J7RFR7_METVO|nr:ribonuclease P protein component 4 [Methanococcus voltae]MBP2201037.1 ribonuclease P protein subunit RPR2 [Methanococcus voltae]MCS3921759.1 ribonuclease P protein subunit RPR2 [Methanococcus voltae PS]
MRKSKKANQNLRNIVNERIDILMNLAEKETKRGNTDRVKRYVTLSRKLAMKIRMSFPKRWKRHICKNCDSFLIYGLNATVRTNPKESCVTITCLECGNIVRIPYLKEKKLKRQLKYKERTENSNPNPNPIENSILNNN